MLRTLTAILTPALLVAVASADPFAPGNLVVMEVSSEFPGGGAAVRLVEFTTAGARVGSPITFDTAGPNAMSMPDISSHDRHIHRSADGRLLTFTMYNTPPRDGSIGGPDGDGAAVSPRVVAVVNGSRAVDTSTRLIDTCDFTGIRGAVTTDGNQFWLACDNASGATETGGLRYCVKGASTSVNLSHVQVVGGSGATTDNVRDVGIFGGQLYECSGSNASIGKGMFIIGNPPAGLPTSGAQTPVPVTTDGVSVAGFALIDASQAIAGPDVVYVATSSPSTLRKHVKQADGTWLLRGSIPFTFIEDVAAKINANGSVTIYAGGPYGIAVFTDAAPLTANLTGTLGAFVITPADGYTLGGFDFAPDNTVTPPACPADLGQQGGQPGADGALDNNDFIVFINFFFQHNAAADLGVQGGVLGHDDHYDNNDFIAFISLFFQGC
ncbi:MAG: GC-type dockerin domain-anchored protein [Phycisphaerales bacterium]